MWVEKTRKAVSMPIFASLNAVSPGAWTTYAKQLAQTGVNGLEVNFYAVPTDLDKPPVEIERALYPCDRLDQGRGHSAHRGQAQPLLHLSSQCRQGTRTARRQGGSFVQPVSFSRTSTPIRENARQRDGPQQPDGAEGAATLGCPAVRPDRAGPGGEHRGSYRVAMRLRHFLPGPRSSSSRQLCFRMASPTCQPCCWTSRTGWTSAATSRWMTSGAKSARRIATTRSRSNALSTSNSSAR